MSKQSSQYDKIFRENIESVIPGLMENVLGIRAVSVEEIPDDIQHTKERKPDLLKQITDSTGKTYILQIEFQVADEPKMVYRMAEYYIMLARKYDLPVKQYVVYLGKAKAQMVSRLVSEYLTFYYSLITFADVDYNIFLQSTQPEEVVLSILANFKNDSTDKALRQIVKRIEETTQGDFTLKRYFRQLRILSQLRNLEGNLKDITMDSISKFVSIERDVAYMVGFDKGEEKGEEKIVASLLKKLNYSLEQIADIAGVSVEFVKNVQQKLASNE